MLGGTAGLGLGNPGWSGQPFLGGGSCHGVGLGLADTEAGPVSFKVGALGATDESFPLGGSRRWHDEISFVCLEVCLEGGNLGGRSRGLL